MSSPVRAPSPSSSALVATVVPWTKSVTSCGFDAAREQLFQRVVHGGRGIARHRGDLGETQRARLPFDRDEIGEGAARIDADHPRAHRSAPPRPLPRYEAGSKAK